MSPSNVSRYLWCQKFCVLCFDFCTPSLFSPSPLCGAILRAKQTQNLWHHKYLDPCTLSVTLPLYWCICRYAWYLPIQSISADISLYRPCNSTSVTLTIGRYSVTICRYTLFIGRYSSYRPNICFCWYISLSVLPINSIGKNVYRLNTTRRP